MDEKLAELTSRHAVQAKSVSVDFAELRTLNEYKQLVMNKFSDINVGIVCLNAGTVAIGPFDLLTDAEVEASLNVNALHPMYLAKALLPKLLSQPNRSAMIVTSSGLSRMPMPSV